MSEPKKIEYRVVATERYIVTRYQEDENGSGVVERGTFTSPHVAHEVAYALAKETHERLGWPIDDERIQYPRFRPKAKLPLSTRSNHPGGRAMAAHRRDI